MGGFRSASNVVYMRNCYLYLPLGNRTLIHVGCQSTHCPSFRSVLIVKSWYRLIIALSDKSRLVSVERGVVI